MNKRVVAAVVVLALVIAGAFAAYLLLGSSAPSPTRTTTATSTAEPVAPTGSASPSPSAGRYIDYGADALAEAEGTRILFFHAPWCPQCRSLEADILRAGVPDGVTIIKVDYDSNQALRQRYGVTIQTTLVEVDASGSELQQFVAYDTPTLQAVIEAML